MTSPDIALADDIAAKLTAEEFSKPFTAERVYVPDWDHKSELQTVQVAVWPDEPTAQPHERRRLLKSYPIAVGVAQRLVAKTRAELDSLADFVMEITDFLELKNIILADPDNRQFVNQGWEFRLRFDMDALDRSKQGDNVIYTGMFASVVSFPFILLD
jgi:hypothetical protein